MGSRSAIAHPRRDVSGRASQRWLQAGTDRFGRPAPARTRGHRTHGCPSEARPSQCSRPARTARAGRPPPVFDAGGGVERRDAGPAGAQPFGRRSLRRELELDLAREELPSELAVLAHVRADRSADPCSASSRPGPAPSTPQLFDTMVRSVAPCASSASIRKAGMPASPNPPTAMLDLSATASSADGRTLSMSTVGLGVEHLTKLAKPGVGGGQSRVPGGVKQDFGELVRAHPVTAGAAQVHS